MKLHFAVHQFYQLDDDSNQSSETRLIVLKDELGCVIKTTGYEIFCHQYGEPISISGPESEYMYVYPCVALNYLFENYDVSSLKDVTPGMVEAFLKKFPEREGKRGVYVGQQAIDRCNMAVSNFFANAANTEKGWSRYLILKEIAVKGRVRTKHCYVPRFKIKAKQCERFLPLRDIPMSFCEKLYALALQEDPMIAFAIAAGVTCGLRGGEIVNLRQPGSPLTANDCIRFTPYIGMPNTITIDLNTEFIMRSDGKQVGKIKKERTVKVYKGYIGAFTEAYNRHMRLLSNTRCEEEFRPMFIGRDGKAMTERTLRNRFAALVRRLTTPLVLSDDPDEVALGNQLLNNRIGLHVLRHCFTVRLLLDTEDISLVQQYRGDASPESAETYLNNKSVLVDYAERGHEAALRDLANIGKKLAVSENDI